MTIRNYTKKEALDEMHFCMVISNITDRDLRGSDRIRNAECYVLARDRAMELGANVTNYPRSLGVKESNINLFNILWGTLK